MLLDLLCDGHQGVFGLEKAGLCDFHPRVPSVTWLAFLDELEEGSLQSGLYRQKMRHQRGVIFQDHSVQLFVFPPRRSWLKLLASLHVFFFFFFFFFFFVFDHLGDCKDEENGQTLNHIKAEGSNKRPKDVGARCRSQGGPEDVMMVFV